MKQGGKQPDREPWKLNLPFAKIAKYLAIGLEIPSAILGGVVFGYLADLYLGTSPWFTVVCSVLGFVGAVFRLVKYVKHFSGDGHQS